MNIEKMVDEVNDLCFKAQELYNKYLLEIKEKNLINNIKALQLSEDESGLIKILSQLSAIGSINKYNNISLSFSRGVKIDQSFLTGECFNIGPSEKESACIKLWSGMHEYQEKITPEYRPC